MSSLHARRTQSHSTRFRWLRLGLGVQLALAVVLLVAYLGVTNSVATQGYELTALQKKLATAEAEQSRLEMSVTAFQSLPRLEAEAAQLALTQQPDIDFIAPAATAVAVR